MEWGRPSQKRYQIVTLSAASPNYRSGRYQAPSPPKFGHDRTPVQWGQHQPHARGASARPQSSDRLGRTGRRGARCDTCARSGSPWIVSQTGRLQSPLAVGPQPTASRRGTSAECHAVGGGVRRTAVLALLRSPPVRRWRPKSPYT
jgi:hypothetical protein